MRNTLTKYFYYTRREKNGVLVLSALCFLTTIVSKSSFWTPHNLEKPNLEQFEAQYALVEAAFAQENSTELNASNETYKPTRYFTFNPNTVSVEDLKTLGLSEKVASTWQNFRNKGGKFYQKEDIRKIYGFSEADYTRLEPYISVPHQSETPFDGNFKRSKSDNFSNSNIDVKRFNFDPNVASELELVTLGLEEKVAKNIIKYRQSGGKFYKKEDLKKIYGFSDLDFFRLQDFIQITDFQKNTNIRDVASNIQTEQKSRERQPLSIDLNRAKSDDLLQLRGIGATFATRIIEQREKLGGFASISQLKDIPGLPDSTYYSILPNLKLATSVYRKISINKITAENFTHPYLTRKQVQAVVRFRLNHGKFSSTNDLMKTAVFSTVEIEKLRLYLDFE